MSPNPDAGSKYSSECHYIVETSMDKAVSATDANRRFSELLTPYMVDFLDPATWATEIAGEIMAQVEKEWNAFDNRFLSVDDRAVFGVLSFLAGISILDFQIPFSISQTAIPWSCELHSSSGSRSCPCKTGLFNAWWIAASQPPGKPAG